MATCPRWTTAAAGRALRCGCCHLTRRMHVPARRLACAARTRTRALPAAPVQLSLLHSPPCCSLLLPAACRLLACVAALACCARQLEAICRSQLEAWAAAPEGVDLMREGKALSLEFSTQLLVRAALLTFLRVLRACAPSACSHARCATTLQVDFDVPPERKADIRAKLDALFQGMFAAPLRLPGTT